MKYSPHFPLIILPETIGQNNQTKAELIKSSHQNYLQEQTRAYQLFLQTQKTISQNITVLIEDNKTLPGPKYSREDLEVLASGKISTMFGDWFAPLDQYEKLIRMPEPPLLLADRVTGIDAQPASMAKGTMWTETDVTQNSWYLHHNHMPAGIMIESGQADLLLISWLGLDFHNRGERTYRLLGCELTYFGDLPKPGDTLCFDIHVDGHAKHENVRLFFFHYDCHVNGKLLIRVRHGQAGFFTEEELTNSGGVLWDAETAEYDVDAEIAKPLLHCEYKKFNRQQIEAFAKGNAYQCFGHGFEITQTHTRTPHISSEKLLFLNEITDFDVQGGPWKKGYMRAIQNVYHDDWFFKGHFKNDPCMPGTLMLEAGLQLMSCYLTACGYTRNKDGWRFEPVPNMTSKLQCRGQVIPTSKQVVYEIFIWSVVAEPIPMIFADLLGTVDGLKAFHTKIGLRLIPDWPFSPHREEKMHQIYDYSSLLACAYGKPSNALGEMYKLFDTYKKVSRLPAPPYHFISRIIDVTAKANSMSTEGEVIVEYDLEDSAWYFEDNNQKILPFCVLMESGLQPCGWLASYLGSALRSDYELKFRNLDGKAKIYSVITPEMKCLRTKVKCTSISQTSGMILESFRVEISNENDLVYEMDTVFGFFLEDSFANQSGLAVPEIEKNILNKSSDFYVDFNHLTERYLNKMPKDMLLMLDRITGYWQENNKIQLRAEKDVKYSDWFFKAHFFQDPVQPGSLGLEAMMQLLQFYLIEKYNIKNQKIYFDNSQNELIWKYRGQVLPTNKLVSIIIIIDSENILDGSIAISATGSLYVDGMRIYEARSLQMRLWI